MATLSAVRDALKARLANISGLRVYDTWPDTVNPPCIIVKALRGDAHTTFSGRGSFFFDLLLVVQIANLERAQDAIDAYLDYSGASSVIATLEADATLGSVVEGLLVNGWEDYDAIEIGDIQYMSARLPVEVWATY